MVKRKTGKLLLILLVLLLTLGSAVSVSAAKAPVPGKTFKLNGRYLKNGVYKVGKYYYYFDKKGKVKTGWVSFPKGRRYFLKKNGRMCTGMTKIGKYDYFFDSWGYRMSGWRRVGSVEYFFGYTTGRRQKSTLVDHNNFYVDAKGLKRTKAGFLHIGGKRYYVKNGGQIAKNEKVNGQLVVYIADNNGVLTVDRSSLGNKIAEFAVRYKGNPYVYGGTSLTHGADCSGFVYAVFSKFGIKLLRTSYEQEKGPSKAQIKNGYAPGVAVKVSTATLKPGDLLFYGVKGNAGHVALYIGNGKVVHALNEKYGITITKYNYDTPVKAMRYW